MMFAFPVLAVGYWWAFRNASVLERVGWALLAVIAATEWVWEITTTVRA